uniref:Uncharacterized protein n=1 Tax=Anopheles maculatus TaxID=74869 RepID=A0A182SLH7_9DIPT
MASCEREVQSDEPEPGSSRPARKEPDPVVDLETEQDGLAIGGGAQSTNGPIESDGEDEEDEDEEDEEEEEDEDEEEEEEPPELRRAAQQDCPPTPYEECLDLKMFEMRTEPRLEDSTREPSEGVQAEQHVQEASVDFADGNRNNPSEPIAVDSGVTPSTSGVRRKSEQALDIHADADANNIESMPPHVDPEPNPNGTKKKVRPNRLSPDRVGCSRKKQFWIEGSSGHRPLERSWPPKSARTHRSSSNRSYPPVPVAGDGFSFDIIDMDEQEQQAPLEAEGAVGGLVGEVAPDVEGNNAVGDASTPLRRMRLDRNGNDTPDSIRQPGKIPLRKMARNVAEEGEMVTRTVRPHRPLARTPSSGREPRSREYGPVRPLPADYTTDVAAPSVHTARSPASGPGSPMRELSPEPARPQPRPLTRVGGRIGSDLVCPPTPTHHARRNRMAGAVMSTGAATVAPMEHGYGSQEARIDRPQVVEPEPDGVVPEDGAAVGHV